jgi:hypothetical protein
MCPILLAIDFTHYFSIIKCIEICTFLAVPPWKELGRAINAIYCRCVMRAGIALVLRLRHARYLG